MDTTDLGRQAEDQVCQHLKAAGYQILARNWRNRYCEIDIVAAKAQVVHIIEVKYRSNPDYGSGFEYITADKLNRLSRAASAFMTTRRTSQPYQIDVAAVSGELAKPAIELMENVTA